MGRLLSNLHSFHPLSATWTNLSSLAKGALPSGRVYGAMAAQNGLLLLFGGWGLTGVMNDLWAFSPGPGT